MAQAATHMDWTDHRDWLEYFARAGYAARGAVYAIIGVLALMAALGSGGQTTGSKGALATLADEPAGRWILGLLGVGLIGYALWRFCQAALDPDHHGSDGKGMVVRTGFVVSGISHTLLAIFALGLAFGWAYSSGSGSGDTQSWTAKLMEQPFGQWLVGLVGLIVCGVGIAQFVRAYREKFKRHLFMPMETWRWASPVSKAGLAARGVVFLIIGGMLLVAAYRANPEEAVGLNGALDTLQQQAYGPWLLGLVAIGLLAFSIYSFLEARYRKIDVPESEMRQHMHRLNIG